MKEDSKCPISKNIKELILIKIINLLNHYGRINSKVNYIFS